ncbi:hypothetical protein CALCODRAFT_497779 [Calocera cornea HHB12733]|uniref:MYND-type domain-containing protein n=1 Tax=Calocera cornea HHB12733 TaxID=1353952 RepID=A0A165F351_9BASI|nr:hypothetical protein CALCODRAFT_497779 [Calocera cornea HHB12733]
MSAAHAKHILRQYKKDIKELRKYYDGCRYCGKTKEEVKLQLCAGCGLHRYCSKDCQKKAWPKHKEMCRQNQRNMALPDKQPGLKKLNSFTQKHKPHLHVAGIRALGVMDDPESAKELVLVVMIREREASDPVAHKTERAYRCFDAKVLALEDFCRIQGDLDSTVGKEIERSNTPEKLAAGHGSVFVAVWLFGSADPTMSICGYPFSVESAKDMEKNKTAHWREDLFAALNWEVPTQEELDDRSVIVVLVP